MTRTNRSTIGLVVVCLGIALAIDMRYAIDLTIALPIILIPTGLYIALVPKRIEEKTAIIKPISELEKKRFDLMTWAKLIVFWVVIAIIIIFLIYHFAADILGLILLGIVLFMSVLVKVFFKR